MKKVPKIKIPMQNQRNHYYPRAGHSWDIMLKESTLYIITRICQLENIISNKFDIFIFRIALKRKKTVRNRLRAFLLLNVEKTKVENKEERRKKFEIENFERKKVFLERACKIILNNGRSGHQCGATRPTDSTTAAPPP